jgi:hypothetical protein
MHFRRDASARRLYSVLNIEKPNENLFGLRGQIWQFKLSHTPQHVSIDYARM